MRGIISGVASLAFCYMERREFEQAEKHFQMVLHMPAPEELHGLARNGLREIAVRELKARGPRMDAVFYLIRLLPSRSSVETTILIMPHHLPHRWIPLNRL